MKRLSFITLLILIALGLTPAWAANRALVSVIFSSDIEPYQQAWSGFGTTMNDKKVALWSSQYFLKQQNPEKIAAQIRAEKPDIVFALGTRAAKFAAQYLNNFPIIYALVLNSEDLSGSNITGVLLDIPAKMELEAVRKIFPEVKKIGAIYSDETLPRVNELNQAALDLGLQLIKKKISSDKELPQAVSDIAWQINCLLMVADTKIYFPQSVRYLLLESLRQKFPVIGLSKLHTKAGALLSVDCDYTDLGRQGGELAMRVLDGEQPGNIPPERPRKVVFSLNLSSAGRLGIKFSPEIIRGTENVFGESEP